MTIVGTSCRRRGPSPARYFARKPRTDHQVPRRDVCGDSGRTVSVERLSFPSPTTRQITMNRQSSFEKRSLMCKCLARVMTAIREYLHRGARPRPSPPCLSQPLPPLRQYLPEQRVIFILIHMMNPYMSAHPNPASQQAILAHHWPNSRSEMLSGDELTSANYPAADTDAPYPDKMDTHTRDYRAPVHAGSFRFCV